MAGLRWSKALYVGVADIDAQHQELVRLIERLRAAGAEDAREQAICRAVDELKAYARDHFALEEGYMSRFGFPDSEAHRLEHEAFVTHVNTLEYACHASFAPYAEMLQFLSAWLVRHIKRTDKQLGEFLLATGALSAEHNA